MWRAALVKVTWNNPSTEQAAGLSPPAVARDAFSKIHVGFRTQGILWHLLASFSPCPQVWWELKKLKCECFFSFFLKWIHVCFLILSLFFSSKCTWIKTTQCRTRSHLDALRDNLWVSPGNRSEGFCRGKNSWLASLLLLCYAGVKSFLHVICAQFFCLLWDH